MYRKQVWNKSRTHFDGRFNSGAFFIYITVRPSTDGKRAPLTAINMQAAGSPQQAPPTYIANMWKLIKFRKNVIFSRNHTDVNPDDWTITKKTIRTTIHENFSKMKNLKVDRWALSLRVGSVIVWVAFNETKSVVEVQSPQIGFPLQWRHNEHDMASQITGLTIVYSNVYSGADQRKHQSSASLAFVWGIHRWPVNSPHKWPITRKMFPFDDVIMQNVTTTYHSRQQCFVINS